MKRSPNFARLATGGVRGMEPYVPGKPVEELERELGISNVLKLASNENPLGPSPRAVAAMHAVLDKTAFYPDGSGFDLRRRLSQHLGVEAEQITLGNGSNDILVLLAETFLTPRTEAVFSEYAFLVYRLATQATGAVARIAPARGADSAQPLGHDLDAMRALVNARTRVVFIANPNNPTGTWLETGPLRAFIESLPRHVIVVLDEAYCEYVGEDIDYPQTLPWIRSLPNLVVTRTFSKIHALAGLRVGYSVSHPQIAELLNRVRQPFNVNCIGLAAALASLDDEEHVERSRRINRLGLAQLGAGLSALGLRMIPSAGNFLLVDLGCPAAAVYESLLRAGVIVRPVANYGLPHHLRISVGTYEQNKRLLQALAAVLSVDGGGAR